MKNTHFRVSKEYVVGWSKNNSTYQNLGLLSLLGRIEIH